MNALAGKRETLQIVIVVPVTRWICGLISKMKGLISANGFPFKNVKSLRILNVITHSPLRLPLADLDLGIVNIFIHHIW